MLLLLALHVAIQTGPPPRKVPPAIVRDSTAADSTVRNAPRRLPVTSAVLASAFHDAAARDLFVRARRSRIVQDSSLTSYDAKVVQRFSVSAGIGRIGREHLAYRQETASRVRWQSGVGARVQLTGARVAVPIAGSSTVDREALEGAVTQVGASPIPYFPGSEVLWVGPSARPEVDERRIVNRLAEGAEAYDTYLYSDSVCFRLPYPRRIGLAEMCERPRKADWNLAV